MVMAKEEVLTKPAFHEMANVVLAVLVASLETEAAELSLAKVGLGASGKYVSTERGPSGEVLGAQGWCS